MKMNFLSRRFAHAGFVTHECLIPIALFALALGLCFPVVAAMRDTRLSPAVGIGLIAAICLIILGPWAYADFAGRRYMRKLNQKEDDAETP
jgi:hypothetical protein